MDDYKELTVTREEEAIVTLSSQKHQPQGEYRSTTTTFIKDDKHPNGIQFQQKDGFHLGSPPLVVDNGLGYKLDSAQPATLFHSTHPQLEHQDISSHLLPNHHHHHHHHHNPHHDALLNHTATPPRSQHLEAAHNHLLASSLNLNAKSPARTIDIAPFIIDGNKASETEMSEEMGEIHNHAHRKAMDVPHHHIQTKKDADVQFMAQQDILVDKMTEKCLENNHPHKKPAHAQHPSSTVDKHDSSITLNDPNIQFMQQQDKLVDHMADVCLTNPPPAHPHHHAHPQHRDAMIQPLPTNNPHHQKHTLPTIDCKVDSDVKFMQKQDDLVDEMPAACLVNPPPAHHHSNKPHPKPQVEEQQPHHHNQHHTIQPLDCRTDADVKFMEQQDKKVDNMPVACLTNPPPAHHHVKSHPQPTVDPVHHHKHEIQPLDCRVDADVRFMEQQDKKVDNMPAACLTNPPPAHHHAKSHPHPQQPTVDPVHHHKHEIQPLDCRVDADVKFMEQQDKKVDNMPAACLTNPPPAHHHHAKAHSQQPAVDPIHHHKHEIQPLDCRVDTDVKFMEQQDTIVDNMPAACLTNPPPAHHHAKHPSHPKHQEVSLADKSVEFLHKEDQMVDDMPAVCLENKHPPAGHHHHHIKHDIEAKSTDHHQDASRKIIKTKDQKDQLHVKPAHQPISDKKSSSKYTPAKKARQKAPVQTETSSIAARVSRRRHFEQEHPPKPAPLTEEEKYVSHVDEVIDELPATVVTPAHSSRRKSARKSANKD